MRRKPRKEGGGSWMDTYGDMVTLLLCFFILLYAVSAVDQTKWSNLVRSLNPDALETLEEATLNPEEEAEAVIEDVPKDFETLYENLKKEVEKRNLNTEIEVKKGNGFTFITFKDKVFFDGYSYVLKETGKDILNVFGEILAPFSNDIKQIQILGHTAEVPGNFNVKNDRFLSSNRATAVVVYLQEKNIVESSKLVSMGYGEYWPIADNSTPEGRAINRRVELLITKVDGGDRGLGEFYKEIMGSNEMDVEGRQD